MIQDVDEALKRLLTRDVLHGSGAELSMDAPTKEWAARLNVPTIDLYLYDIREDLARRRVGQVTVRDPAGRITGRTTPPRFFRLSYLITAWTQRPEDEHLLLSAALGCMLSADVLDPELITGPLAAMDDPVTITIASPPVDARSVTDMWSAMGGELKPSLDLVVSTPIDLKRLAPVAGLVLESPKFRFETEGEGEDRRKRREASMAEESVAATPSAAEEKLFGGGEEHRGRVFTVHSHPRP
jgi:hypothetical protein